MGFIQLHDVNKVYRTAAGDFPALRQINLDIGRGEIVSIVGKSGSGKTTLLNLLTGIDTPTDGEVLIENVPIHQLREDAAAVWRGANVGIVFQFFQLFPLLTVAENILMALDFANRWPRPQRRQRALDLLDQVGIVDHADKFPAQLSGGQQQRAAIARALANDPPLLVADEPTGNLDSQTADAVISLFEGLAEAGRTVVIVTHDEAIADRTQRKIVLADGVIVKEQRHELDR